MRFVIADDMGPALRFLKRVIVQAGHTVVGEASNGLQAVQLCTKYHPDVAVLDVSMPVMTGLEAAREIFKNGSAAHVIIVSTTLQEVVKKQLRALGCRIIPKSDEDAWLLRELAAIEHG